MKQVVQSARTGKLSLKEGPAPRVRADRSSLSSTPSMAVITALISRGKATKAAASAAATHVNTSSTPKAFRSSTPMGPSRPRSSSRA